MKETVEEYLARGGEITVIPPGHGKESNMRAKTNHAGIPRWVGDTTPTFIDPVTRNPKRRGTYDSGR